MSKNETKKAEELDCLEKFKHTSIGSDWYSRNAIVRTTPCEPPDFLFQTRYKGIIGLEIADIIAANENTRFSQALKRIGDQVCHYVKQTYNIDISMSIDKFNKNMFCRKDYRLSAYKMGFSDLPSSKGLKELKRKISELLDNHIDDLRKWPFLIKGSMEIEGDYFTISANITCEPYITHGCSVNNALRIIEDPIDVVQQVISDKNEKFDTYLKKCNRCSLLLYVSYFKKGSVCSFSKKLLNHKFNSKFKEIFLYDEEHNITYLLKRKKTSFFRWLLDCLYAISNKKRNYLPKFLNIFQHLRQTDS